MAVKKAKASKAKKSIVKKSSPKVKGSRYVCVPCGTEVVMTECGPEFTELVCCGVRMKKK